MNLMGSFNGTIKQFITTRRKFNIKPFLENFAVLLTTFINKPFLKYKKVIIKKSELKN